MAIAPAILGRPVSPATVSQVAKQLDAAVAAFHRRPLKDIYRVLVLDGVVLKRKTGAGALARPVLVALGWPDGKKEVIDFRLATAESAAQWEHLLGDLVRRGLVGERLEMLCVDGGDGPARRLAHRLPRHSRPALLGAQDPQRARQGPQGYQAEVKADLHRIMNAPTLPAAWSAARRFADRWEDRCPRRSPACVPTSPIS